MQVSTHVPVDRSKNNLALRLCSFEPFYQFVELPKLYVEAVNERPGMLFGFCFVFARQIDPIVNVPVWSHDIGPIVWHLPSTLTRCYFGDVNPGEVTHWLM